MFSVQFTMINIFSNCKLKIDNYLLGWCILQQYE